MTYPLSLSCAISAGIILGAAIGRDRVEAESWNGGAAPDAQGEITRLDAGHSQPAGDPAAAVPIIRDSRIVLALVTSYCPCATCCPGTADGITATGRSVRRHPWGVASAWSRIPQGTRLRIPGYHGGQVVTADDTGADMKRSARRGIVHLDVRMRTHQAARRWGRRWLRVEVM